MSKKFVLVSFNWTLILGPTSLPIHNSGWSSTCFLKIDQMFVCGAEILWYCDAAVW